MQQEIDTAQALVGARWADTIERMEPHLEALRRDPGEPPIGDLDPHPHARATADDDAAIRCARCDAVITTPAARIAVHGAHEHRRVNPSGVDFHVGCFAHAPGCVAEGTPTSFWTWFPGHPWRLAHCRRCGAHLGWAYDGAPSFFGLVLANLRADE